MVLVILDLHLKLSTSETFSDGQMEDTGFKYFVPAKLKLLIIGTQVWNGASKEGWWTVEFSEEGDLMFTYMP